MSNCPKIKLSAKSLTYALYHNSFQMKVYLVLLLAAIALVAITSAANIRDVEDGQEDTQAVVEGQLGWIAETDNQLGEIRWVLNLMCNFQKKIVHQLRVRGK